MSESRAQNIKVGVFVIGLSLTVLVLSSSWEALPRCSSVATNWRRSGKTSLDSRRVQSFVSRVGMSALSIGSRSLTSSSSESSPSP